MSVRLGQVVALNYATTQLEATHVLVTLATSLQLTTKHAVVGAILPPEYFLLPRFELYNAY